MAGKYWTNREEHLAISMMEKGKTYGDIAEALGRTKPAVICYWKRVRPKYGDYARMDATHVSWMLGINPHTMRDWLRKGRIKASKSHLLRGAGQEWRFTHDEIEVFLKDWRWWPAWSVDDIRDPEWKEKATEIRAEDNVISISQASKIIGWSREVLRTACARGELPATKSGNPGWWGKGWYVRTPDLLEWGKKRV